MTTPYHCKIHAVAKPCASCIELGLEPCSDVNAPCDADCQQVAAFYEDKAAAKPAPANSPEVSTKDFVKGYTFPCGHTIGFKEGIQTDVLALLGEEAMQAVSTLQSIQLNRHANRLCTSVDLMLDFTLDPIIRAKDTKVYSIKGEPAETMACGHKVHKELAPEVVTDLMAYHGKEATDDAKKVLAHERLKHQYSICQFRLEEGQQRVQVEVTNGIPKFLLLRGEYVLGELVTGGRFIKSEPKDGKTIKYLPKDEA